MKKIIVILLLIFVGYNSVYFEKLSDQELDKISTMDFEKYADSLYHQGILKQKAPIDLDELLQLMKTDKNGAFSDFGNRLGIGTSAYFMVSSNGILTNVNDKILTIKTPDNQLVTVDTKYVFGNAIRDASKLVKLTDFKTNAEFNQLSEALNKLLRDKILLPIIPELTTGDTIFIRGAVKLSKIEKLPFIILPVSISKTQLQD